MILVRDGRLGTPPPCRTLEQRDPQGQILRTLNLSAADGRAAFSLDIPDWSLTGQYSLQIESGGLVYRVFLLPIRVEDFIPESGSAWISTARRMSRQAPCPWT